MTPPAIGRNQPCPCGSGKKYKHCCGAHAGQQVQPSSKLAQSLSAAWNLFRQGFLDDAEREARTCLDATPDWADAWHLLAAVALSRGQTGVAVDYGQHAIKLNGSNPEFHNNLALAYHEMGQLAPAVQHYQRALALAPRYPDALFNLHAALLRADDADEALAALKKAQAANPDDLEVKFMLALLYDHRGAVEQAEPLFGSLGNHALIEARLDAWNYLKQTAGKAIPLLGSAVDVFRLALTQAQNTGLVLEFGVRFGNSIRMLAELAQQPIHGFDSFEGLPDAWHHEPKGSYTTKGVLPEVPGNVTLHKGWFDQTLPEFLQQHTDDVRLINVDCDIYSSTKTVLALLAPRIKPGTVIVFDEYIGNRHWREDEFKAFQEAVDRYGWQYEYLCCSFFTKQVAVRINSI